MSAKINLKYFLKEFLITNKTLDAHKGGEWGHFPLWQISPKRGPSWQFGQESLDPTSKDFSKTLSYSLPWIFNLYASMTKFQFDFKLELQF
jgi:hypothetical protein